MGLNLAGLNEWPIAAWVILLGIVLFVGQYGVLRWRWSQARPRGREAERRLTEAASRLRDYADANLQRLPDRLQEAGLEAGAIAYRPIPSLTLDERLILLHDAQPEHKLLEFPTLRDGRGVVLCSGRLLLVTESAFEKLIEADNALRSRLGLDPE
jgi:hypothetical protein